MNADEIVKTLQAQFDKMRGAYEVMSALAEMRKEEIESLQAQLSESQRRADAAVEDINGLGRFEQERCAYCIHDDECEPGEMLCSYNGDTAFEWRGPHEAREGDAPND